jgi:acetyltransferase
MGKNPIGNGAAEALRAFMYPNNIAVAGASNKPGKPGSSVMTRLMAGGFAGGIYPVNPASPSVMNIPAFKSVSDLPVAPDLGIVIVPAPGVPDVVEEFGKKGTKAVVVISAGLGEKASDGRAWTEHMLEKARKHKVRIVGPNCIGVQSPHVGLNASFMSSRALPGHIGLVSQSGALSSSAVDWGSANGIGFSHIFSIGDAADVDIADVLEFLASDEACRSIVIYMESIRDPEKFVRAAHKAAVLKPIYCLKSGRSSAAQKAAASHTGALASNDEFYDAMLRRAGVMRVDNFEQVFELAQVAGSGIELKSDRLTILTNGGGDGIITVDRLSALGGRLTELKPETIAKLDKALPIGWSRSNPVDIIGDAPGERYAAALDILKRSKEVDAVFTIFCPTGINSSADVAGKIVDTAKKNGFKNLFFSFTGGEFVEGANKLFRANGFSTLGEPEDGAEAFMSMLRACEISKKIAAGIAPLERSKPAKSKGYAAAKKIIGAVARTGRDTLTEAEAKEVFGLYGIPTVATYVAKDAKAAGEFALKNIKGAKVAIKIASEEISHKSDVSGVMLWIEPKDVERSCEAMLKTVRANVGPKVKIQGFAVQEMIDKSEMLELLVGTIRDKVFGPVIMFGTGGKAVEVEKDSACELIPLDERLAIETVQRTRIYRKIKGYRDVKPVDMKQLAKIMTSVSDMMLDFPEILSLDINPLLADAKRIVAVDARIIISTEKD